ncbi:hypothetical protein NQZ68_026681 [Dissostichus eleginoides]|nr:hypothetical protein NQZ68_026681 [Dissostichus eleginoides]
MRDFEKPLNDNRRRWGLCRQTVNSVDPGIKRFTEGITNQLMGCFVAPLQEPGCVLVRLYGQMTELFVNRDRELEMFQVLHAHGCGPQIFCSFQNGICYEFVRGTVLEDELLLQPSIYRLIAAEMGRIHSIQPKCGASAEPLLWTKMSHFLTLVQSRNSSSEEQRGTKSYCRCWSFTFTSVTSWTGFFAASRDWLERRGGGGACVAVTLLYLCQGSQVRGERGLRDTTKKQALGPRASCRALLIGQTFNFVYVRSRGVGSPRKLKLEDSESLSRC